jgi:hypothetical protein
MLDVQSRADSPALPLGDYTAELIDRRITDGDAAQLLRGVEAGLVLWRPYGRFDTLDRPLPGRGRWWLIEKDGATRRPCWEFVPQLAAYVELIADLGFHRHRVLFDTPASALQLDLAVLDDDSRIVILGEAKKESAELDKLERGLVRYLDVEPEPKRADEPRQLAWRLWKTRAPYLWLVGPNDRRAYQVHYDPVRLTRLPALPQAAAIDLHRQPPDVNDVMLPPQLR